MISSNLSFASLKPQRLHSTTDFQFLKFTPPLRPSLNCLDSSRLFECLKKRRRRLRCREIEIAESGRSLTWAAERLSLRASYDFLRHLGLRVSRAAGSSRMLFSRSGGMRVRARATMSKVTFNTGCQDSGMLAAGLERKGVNPSPAKVLVK